MNPFGLFGVIGLSGKVSEEDLADGPNKLSDIDASVFGNRSSKIFLHSVCRFLCISFVESFPTEFGMFFRLVKKSQRKASGVMPSVTE